MDREFTFHLFLIVGMRRTQLRTARSSFLQRQLKHPSQLSPSKWRTGTRRAYCASSIFFSFSFLNSAIQPAAVALQRSASTLLLPVTAPRVTFSSCQLQASTSTTAALAISFLRCAPASCLCLPLISVKSLIPASLPFIPSLCLTYS